MRGLFTLAALAALGLSACDRLSTEAEEGPLTGTWRYNAVGHPHLGGELVGCDFEIIFTVTQTGNVIEGESQETVGTCTHRFNRTRVQDYFPGGWVYGEVEDGRIHFSIVGNFHSFGEVPPGQADRITGHTEFYSDPPTHARGSFVLERL